MWQRISLRALQDWSGVRATAVGNAHAQSSSEAREFETGCSYLAGVCAEGRHEVGGATAARRRIWSRWASAGDQPFRAAVRRGRLIPSGNATPNHYTGRLLFR